MDPTGVVDLSSADLAATLARLEQRVSRLEDALAVRNLPVGEAPRRPAPQVEPGSEWTVLSTVALTGRTLIVLGGAYLLRALTEGGVMPPSIGIAAGLAYAVALLALCWRAVAGPNAIFHGLSATLVAYPIIWESLTRFDLMPPVSGATLLAACTAAVLATARHRRLEPVGWFAALGATITGFALAVATDSFVPYTLVVALVGIGALWLGYLHEWVGIRWPVAFVADIMVLLVTLAAVSPNPPAPIRTVVTLQLTVLVLYLGSFVARALSLGREVIPFEVAQSAAVMTVGFGGAFWVLRTTNLSVAPLGIAALIAGVCAYAFAFVYLEPRKHWRTLAFFTSHAVAFVLAGMATLLPQAGIVSACAVLAVLCAEWARRTGRLTLAAHACVYSTATAYFSGLLAASSAGLLAAARTPWPRVDGWMLLAFFAVVAIAGWSAPAVLKSPDRPGVRVLRMTRLVLLVWITSGLAILLLTPVLAGATGPATDAGLVATIRTIVLTIVAAALVLFAGSAARLEHARVAYVMLALVGLKLLADDLPRGRASTLFAALAVYGAALIIVPRVARRDPPTGDRTTA